MSERVRLVLRFIHYGEYLTVWDEIPMMMRPYYHLHRWDGWWHPIFHPNPCSDEMLRHQALAPARSRGYKF